MTYYRIKDDKIIDCAEYRYHRDCFETDQEIVSTPTGELLFANLYTPPAPTYQELRQKAYPTLGDQLDMIYWDKMNGTNKWMEKISEIKAQYPKPKQEAEVEE